MILLLRVFTSDAIAAAAAVAPFDEFRELNWTNSEFDTDNDNDKWRLSENISTLPSQTHLKNGR